MTNYIAYYRVSTDKQGRSGLGLEAQQEAVAPYRDQITHSFTEIESGSDNHRPQLQAAIAMCKSAGATLLIAKIDRLSRDAGFLLTLRSSGLSIMAADMPTVGTLEFGIRAVFAQHEREEISRRTKAALAAAKARGQKLGSPNPRAGGLAVSVHLRARKAATIAKVMPIVRDLQALGMTTTRQIAEALTQRGIQTATGATTWHSAQVSRLLAA
jgi:DNA invertase Pin-like site-specific DNA recombinase